MKLHAKEKGGFAIEAPIELGFNLNRFLKIPTSIMLRIAEFKCRDLPKLYNKVAKIKWSNYLVGDQFRLDVSCKKSRLLNEKKVEKTVSDGVKRHFVMQPAKKPKVNYAFEVKVRFNDDLCTLSLNTSGEPLFKRGYKVMSGTAPLRENLAAALFWSLWLRRPSAQALIDPMCGTGTFLLEAAQFWQSQSRYDFACVHSPFWKEISLDWPAREPLKLIGYDSHKKNIETLMDSMVAIRVRHSQEWQVSLRDLFKEATPPVPDLPTLLICNPPYGVRLNLPIPPEKYYNQLVQKLLSFQPEVMGVIVPKSYYKFVNPIVSGYRIVDTIDFENGGLAVQFCIFEKS